ncbi:egl nine homolog 1-like [Dreissena polymorpha]|uniref:hypoxia-inducible factor-proline dioxygenase n=1 Tax=Dreissena polymorpha TaxID=45954 RepID=A0A9D4QX34_DREPO|nr:egl nine homolog 1-like [Dreissena polymorpha]KAH3846764.1 hypothetical protein DPMN_089070 [Dreissena polymorpha]
MAECVRDLSNIHIDSRDKCAICGKSANLKYCSGCGKVSYCSRDHQIQDWRQHKAKCKKKQLAETDDNPRQTPSAMANVASGMARLAITQEELQDVTSSTARVPSVDLSEPIHAEMKLKSGLFTIIDSNVRDQLTEEPLYIRKKLGIDDSSHNSSVHNIDNTTRNNSTEVDTLKDIATCSTLTNSNNLNTNSRKRNIDAEDVNGTGSSERFILESEDNNIVEPVYESASSSISDSSSGSMMPYFNIMESRNKALSDYVTKCLNAYGVCVIDNFLGDSKGTDILDEVKDLHENGELLSGQLVNASSPKGAVRGDVITWVDGTEPGCGSINSLITSIDAIMVHCERTLGQYHVKGRSKAMVAVYPGNKTYFLRHVDNPTGDGRCVTCIYYLNKNWNSKNDGGLLRIFPEGANKVANVEPKFDRLLFFWSDRRNPHEVLPAYRTRYAITVWYYDEQERRRAVKRFKEQVGDSKSVYPPYGLTDMDDKVVENKAPTT